MLGDKHFAARCSNRAGSRCESLDIFRCVLMFLIVTYHCYCHGIWGGGGQWWSIFFTSFIIWHVDGFVAISGFFGLRFSWGKVIRLWGMMAFYSGLSLCYLLFSGKGLSPFTVNGGWFGGTYLMLLMLSPLLNLLIERLSEEKTDVVLSCWGLFALSLVADWLPRAGYSGLDAGGVDQGASIIMFVFIYLTVRLIKLNLLTVRPSILRGGGVMLFIALSIVFHIMSSRLIAAGLTRTEYSTYNAPHVWGMAVLMLLMFERFARIPQWIGRVAVWMAPSMFGIYLLHDTTCFGKDIYRVPELWMQRNTSLPPFLIIILCSILTFLVGLGVETIRRWGWRVLCCFFAGFVFDVPRRGIVYLMKIVRKVCRQEARRGS